jgi:hypothetical protein
MTDTPQDLTAPWDGYDDAPADELIDAATRKRSEDRLHDAVEYEKANKNRVTVIDAFEARLSELDGDDDSGTDDTSGGQTSDDTNPRGDVPASKGQPGEIRKGDAVTPAGAEDTSSRKTTGQIAAQESQERQQRDGETLTKAEKAAAEGGVTPLAPTRVGPVYAAENRQDRIELAGQQTRVAEDVDPDPNYAFDTDAALEAPLVDHVAVASSTAGLFLEIDGQRFRFDRDLSIALANAVRSGMVAVHY